MTDKVNPIPEGYHTITASLTIRDCAKALEFYQEAFGAEVVDRAPSPDGGVWHASVKIGDSMLMMNDEFPEQGAQAPPALGGTPVGLWMYVADVDEVFARAVDAGCEVAMPPADMFWGDRMAKVVDPFGHEWSLATHVEDVSPEEMEKRQQAAIDEWGD